MVNVSSFVHSSSLSVILFVRESDILGLVVQVVVDLCSFFSVLSASWSNSLIVCQNLV